MHQYSRNAGVFCRIVKRCRKVATAKVFGNYIQLCNDPKLGDLRHEPDPTNRNALSKEQPIF